MVAEVTVIAEAATIVKNEVQVVKDKAQKIVDGIGKEKAIAEGKLEAARPALEEAEAALNVRFVWLEHICIFTPLCVWCLTRCTHFYRPSLQVILPLWEN